MDLLRSTFRHLEPSAGAYRKYLSATPSKTENTIHREPFKPDEIKAILDAVADDELMRPLITATLCTAMRRGDCAMLKWSAVIR
jgi:integrase